VSYVSEPLPADLAEALDRARSRLGKIASRTFYFQATGSTNDVASTLTASGIGEGAVVLADAQTAGRGRRGRSWFSPPLSGLYVSVVFEPRRAVIDSTGDTLGDPGNQANRARMLLTLTAGVAIAEGVQATTGLHADIKWPNDLLIGPRKLAGILAEGAAADAVVLGYGINVGAMAYPPELASRATSLEVELGRAIDRTTLCVETLVALARRYDDLVEGRFDAILGAWRERAPGSTGRRVMCETSSGPQSGITAGIDEQGALLVRVGNRVERIVAGEVVWT
jgi:BirA family transcriptional regulator, biotin operon repressor / biotin---[acetyl-CoA-carboxylase] ligase